MNIRQKDTQDQHVDIKSIHVRRQQMGAPCFIRGQLNFIRRDRFLEVFLGGLKNGKSELGTVPLLCQKMADVEFLSRIRLVKNTSIQGQKAFFYLFTQSANFFKISW